MAIDELDKLPSLKTRLAKLSPETTQHYMYKVPGHLREVNSKAFEPQTVAIGPYYDHGRPELKRMEEVKLLYMQQLLELIPNVTLEHYISAVKEIAEKARDCYEEPPMKLDDFTDMLVLDGCFIIQITQDRKHFLRTFPDRSRISMLHRDLILLENQIPFFVLCKLFDLIQGPRQHSLLMKRVLEFCEDIFPGKILYRATTMRRSEEVQHILDLIHSNYCPHYINSCVDDDTTSVPVQWCCASTTISSSVIPSASELKDANIKFRNKEYHRPPHLEDEIVETRPTSLFDVEFNDSNGQMVMPTLVIDDGTESLLRNLIAYEQLFPDGRPAFFVDYMTLLDCLINTPKDVQILCGANIIENLLGSEEVVMELVNKLGEGVTIDNFMYEDTFRRINVHHKKCWNRAVAALRRDYFNTPWAYIAFLGALILFLLTAAQTIFSALQL